MTDMLVSEAKARLRPELVASGSTYTITRGRDHLRRPVGAVAMGLVLRRPGDRARRCARPRPRARPFYERLGFEVFAQIDGPPPAFPRVFMKKLLPRSSP